METALPVASAPDPLRIPLPLAPNKRGRSAVPEKRQWNYQSKEAMVVACLWIINELCVQMYIYIYIYTYIYIYIYTYTYTY